MIIYGWNTKNIKQANLEDYECPRCKERNSVIAVFAHYAHVFWIPLFPYKKSIDIVCQSCNHRSNEFNLESEKKGLAKQLKSTVPFPKYLFSGLFVILLGAAYFTYSSVKESNQEQSYVENPQIGDVYIILDDEELSEYNHFLLKVDDIEEDTLWVTFSSYSYNGVIDQLDPRDGFYDVVYSMHTDELEEYYESGDLKKVYRDYDESSGFNRVIEYQMPDSLVFE
jgi:DNA-directed RNA polymerase subunit RPC12/RpoP